MLQDLKNKFDFFLRNRIQIRRPIPQNEQIHNLAADFQKELEEFLSLFHWSAHKIFTESCVVADVGTRTFAIAPVIEKLFQKLNPTPEIHGFEVDAYRRFTNLRTRADYGQYYSRKVKNGYYHAGDFRSTEKKFDMIFNLHPFVTETAHVAWGLPLKVYDPVGLFSHCHRSLAHSGLFLLSSPNEEEYVRALNLSASVGFNLIEEKKWFPTPGSSQKQPRHGALFIK